MPSQHISQQYNAELEDVRDKVMTMGGLVEQQLTNAIIAITQKDNDLAEQVIATDVEINTLEVAIDEECTQILARRQPAASDLRLLVAIIKTITDLERIGDEAEKVARMALHLNQMERPTNNYMELEHLGQHVRQVLHGALDAFARTDIETAFKIAAEDTKVDIEYESTLRQLMTFMMEDPRSIRRVIDVMWAARALERIGDHAVNICEYVIYFVKGKDVRHTNLEQIKKDVIS